MSSQSLFLSIFLGVSLFTTAVFADNPIRSIEIVGNHRVETPTIMSYIDVKTGEMVTESKIDEILKNLYATGLFADVIVEQPGDRLLIKVVENKIINRIAFEGMISSRMKS